ncbi:MULTISPECIES: protein translocase subunit SecF [unclassified Corynebacterium]|uniref:protein translocase subunit SecF n=1 Tax=unclassified Corynebacterium TaxID=2624378 RepID=UPI0030AA3C22
MSDHTSTKSHESTIDASLDADAKGGFLNRLHTGAGGFDIVGRSRRWYAITAMVLVVAIGAMLIRGFTLGIDFEGGTRMTMPPETANEQQVEQVFKEATGVSPQLVQIIGAGDARVLEITSERLGEDKINDARAALFDKFQPKDATGNPSPDAIGDSTVSESWGGAITNRMLLAMAVFLGLVFAYIAIRFERDMAISAIAALLIDGIVIAGIYALIGFEVSPATVIGLLTVLSFSLYDTVVVFDKVMENTAGFKQSTRRTYGELVNLAVNQTLMRSINTTVSTALPILALMVIAVGMLGVGTLKDLALVQLIGIIQGTFSSIFLASPFLVSLKNRQKSFRDHDAKVAEARAGGADHQGIEAMADLDETPATKAPAESAASRRRVVTPELSPGDDDRPSGSLSWRPGR